jgi:hypothetical protein
MPTLSERLDVILVNLNIISRLNVTDRLIFSNKQIQIRQYYRYLTPIIRAISGESREDIISGLKDYLFEIERLFNDMINEMTVHNTIDTINLYRLNSEITKIYDIENKGLNSLIVTYEGYRETIAKLENIITNFKMLNSKIEQKIKDIN